MIQQRAGSEVKMSEIAGMAAVNPVVDHEPHDQQDHAENRPASTAEAAGIAPVGFCVVQDIRFTHDGLVVGLVAGLFVTERSYVRLSEISSAVPNVPSGPALCSVSTQVLPLALA